MPSWSDSISSRHDTANWLGLAQKRLLRWIKCPVHLHPEPMGNASISCGTSNKLPPSQQGAAGWPALGQQCICETSKALIRTCSSAFRCNVISQGHPAVSASTKCKASRQQCNQRHKQLHCLLHITQKDLPHQDHWSTSSQPHKGSDGACRSRNSTT